MTKLLKLITMISMLLTFSRCTMITKKTLPSDVAMYQFPEKEETPYFILKKGTEYDFDFQFHEWCFIRALNNDVYGFIQCSEINVDTPTGPLSGLTVIVDAGHGGLDAGAHYFGTAEKDVNLAVTLLTAKYLREAGANVVLTRKDDETVRLYTRPTYANLLALLSLYSSTTDKTERNELKPMILNLEEMIVNNSVVMPKLYEKADETKHISPELAELMNKIKGRNDTILLSIHSNSTKDQNLKSRGTEVINATNQLSSEYPGYIYYDDAARKSLMEDLQASFISTNALPWRKSYSGDYAVLRESNVPSLLIELGYLNNEEDFKLLQSTTVQEALAKAITDGVINWYKKTQT